jgi:hypothetical protein
MKTLIITGTYKNVTDESGQHKVLYSLGLFGQSEQHPLCECIAFFELECDNSRKGSSYGQMQEACRAKYCSYFNTDDFNIITMVNLNPIK